MAAMTRLQFWVPGIPRPQGSKRHVGRGVMVESSKYVEDWRHAITQAAWTYRLERPTITAPVAVRLDFYLPRPKYHLKPDGTVRDRYALTRPKAKPDASKLVRAVEDAITDAGLWADDSLVVSLRAEKWYADDTGPGVEVLIVVEETWG